MEKYTLEDLENSFANNEHYTSILSNILTNYYDDKNNLLCMLVKYTQLHSKKVLQKEIDHLVNEQNWF